MPYTIVDAAQWPEILERERSISWIPEFFNERGPPGLDGTSQYRNSIGGGLWRAVFAGVQLRRSDHRRAWLEMEVVLRGGATPIDVPLLLCDPSSSPTTPVTTDAEWPARSIGGRIAIADNADDYPLLKAGVHFSFNHSQYGWRLHRIESVTPVVGQESAKKDITFWPPTRQLAPISKTLVFNNPRCVMRLASSNSMDLELEMRKRGNPNAEFIEAY